jgi:hypothetical protein
MLYLAPIKVMEITKKPKNPPVTTRETRVPPAVSRCFG